MIDLKQSALECAAFGLAVFPVRPKDKLPAIKDWRTQATQDSETIINWWGKNPAYNIGIACGKASGGLVVIDLDVDTNSGKNGKQRFEAWAKEAGASIPQTAEATTGRGGVHLYFRSDLGQYKNTVDLFRDSSGVDVRSEGGFVVAPGSVHKNGTAYKWTKHPTIYGISALPQALEQLLVPNGNKNAASTSVLFMSGEIPQGQRTARMVQLLGSLQSKGLSDTAIRAAIREENDSRCSPPLTDEELECTVFPALSRFQKATAPYSLDREYNLDISTVIDMLKTMRPERNGRYSWNDAGNGNLFADLNKDTARYVPERKKWYYYDGSKWVADTGNVKTMERCKEIANALCIYAVQCIPESEQRVEYMKFLQKWQQRRYRETILADAASVNPLTLQEFDSDPFLFNCINGTLNLKDGRFYAHRSGDLITKLANVHYAPNARCERWEQFIAEISCGNADLSRYIQKALGYTLTGDTSHECLFILYGPTSRNGKGTLCETYMRLMGTYGRAAAAETLAQRRNNDSRSPSEDLAKLAGARYVSMAEADKKMTFDAGKLKTMTGNDTITARFLNENSFDFRPQFKLFLNTNHLPYVGDATIFYSDRVKVIPFKRHFSEAERDTQLKQRLASGDSLSGVLNWCIEGLRLLQREGWRVPDVVEAETKDYAANSDKLGQFVEETLQRSLNGECDARAAHAEYQEWCFRSGLKAEGFSEFLKGLASAGIEVKRKRPNGAGRDVNKKQIITGYTLAKM